MAKVLKVCRKYLHWVQNSVFEGEITMARLEKLKQDLRKIINEDEDSVVIYLFRSMLYSKREIMGVEKGGEEFVF